ncbi:MAG: M23 family metallopeptidase [Candidatus Omnitrophica bacterium]|nr:M23 family metallopeptidase [Candidatus Omnitrophota bacterium]
MNPIVLIAGTVAALALLASRKASGAELEEDLSDEFWLWPVPDYKRISSAYGWRVDPLSGKESWHAGIDISAASGVPVFAARSGRVVYSAFAGAQSYGERLVIDHGDGFSSTYSHLLTRLMLVGDVVEAGDLIAQVGSTGRSTGPHLHLEILIGDVAMDPLMYLEAP